jgi:hypothetical protein
MSCRVEKFYKQNRRDFKSKVFRNSFFNLNSQDGTPLGAPDRVENIGETQLPYSVFLDYALSIADTKYR